MRLKGGWVFIFSLFFTLGIFLLGYCLPRTSFNLSLAVFSGCFILYWKLYQMAGSAVSWKWLVGLAVVLRLILVFSMPQWSDDYARFLWDGQLVAEGYNPYTLTPSEAKEQLDFRSEEFMGQLFPVLNSPDYHSVYPPTNQVVFFLASFLSGGDILKGVVIIRLILLVFELLVFYLIFLLLRLFDQPEKKLLLYALNPMVIMEVAGNLHFEGMMLLMILVSIYFLYRGRFGISGGSLAAAVAVKLSPLILFPAFLNRLPRKRRLRYLFAAAFILLITLGPLVGSAFPGFGKSLSLYSDTFEFNASLYYLFRQLGYWTAGYNVIEILGPMLKVLTLILILTVSFRGRKKDTQGFLQVLLMIYWVYFLLNTVVHPWYLIPAVGISVFTEKKAFLIWSFLVILSYHAYQSQPYVESSTLLVLQYLGVGIALWKDGFHRQIAAMVKQIR